MKYAITYADQYEGMIHITIKKYFETVSEACIYVLLMYIGFVVLLSTVPYLFRPAMDDKARKGLSKKKYYGDAQNGPDRIALIESTTTAFGVRVSMIRSAEESMDIVYYTLGKGDSTHAFLGEVLRAAERGVKVRILIDGKFGVLTKDVEKRLTALAYHPNVICRQYNPIQWLKPWTWHCAMHDKFIITDSKYLLLGGRNLGDKFINPSNFGGKVSYDRDALVWNAGLEASGQPSVLVQAEKYMRELWEVSRPLPLKKRKMGNIHWVRDKIAMTNEARSFENQNHEYYQYALKDYLAQTMPSRKVTLLHNPVNAGVKQPWIGYQLRRLALSAVKRVIIQTPYATANPAFLRILRRIRKSVQSLVFLTNSVVSSPNFPAFSDYYSHRFEFAGTGSEIYEYYDIHSIHGKSLIVDDSLSSVGSFNLDDRSLYINTESMLVVDSEEFTLALSAAMTCYIRNSKRVGSSEPHGAAHMPFYFLYAKKLLMYAASVFSSMFRFLV